MLYSRALLDLSLSSSISAVRAVPLLFSFVRACLCYGQTHGRCERESSSTSTHFARLLLASRLDFPYGDSSAVLMLLAVWASVARSSTTRAALQ